MPIPLRKRELAAKLSGALGVTSILEGMPKRKVLIVLNYHRIGNSGDTPYDPGVFSATAEEFERQIAYLKRRFYMTTLDEAVAMVKGDVPLRPSVLITFDDGYLDNYTLAFPILRSHGVQGVFFLPTSYVGTSHVPWWDAIAYIIKHSRKEIIRLQYPEAAEFDRKVDGITQVIMKTLRLYKQPSMTNHGRFLDDLQTACDAGAPPPNAERCFMSWQEAREMQEKGMAFGSHTHTHEILGRLSVERQIEECRQSREMLERELNRSIDVLAYPVGARHTFTPQTIQALKTNGYRAAFSFYGGFNRPGETQPFDICRFGVDRQSYPRFRLKVALGAFTGRHWL
jgi:peptidoglycan/xylan/chitin deacetylase (PgdA/CDA1 family)